MFQDLCGNLFTKIDLTHAFLQIPLTDEAKELTTINTPFGLFQYNRLPFGLNVSPGVFQRSIDKVIHGLHGVKAYQDDIIVSGSSQQEHDQRLQLLLQRLKEYNVKINAEKSEFCVRKLKYLGYILDGNGISPDIERIRSVKDAPMPDSPKKLQSFLGFAQFYARFVPNFSAIVQPLYAMLQLSDFKWTKETTSAYNELLQSLLHGKVLKSFRLGVPTELVVDASEFALGAVLHQEEHPIICISRKLSKSEQNYSQTMKEALAIHWATMRLHKYLYGQDFTIITDHQALIYIFSQDASLSKATSRMLQRWALDLSGYTYDIKHRPGKLIQNADYLSRYSQFEEPPTEIAFVQDLPVTRNLLIEETKNFFGPIIAGLKHGWSTSAKKRFPVIHANRERLQLTGDGVILFDERPLIPPTLRHELLKHLHSGHLGRDKMISLSRLICWWPQINADITTFNRNCQNCLQKPKSHPSWTPWPLPFQPMQRVHVDYCGPILNHYALIIQDAYSKFPEVFLTTNATSEFTKLALQKFFAREGVAQVLVSDNGTHFTAAELQTWLKSIGCNPIQIAPRHPQSNGLAENFVRTLKQAVKASSPKSISELHRCIDTFLLHFRNARHATTGKAPAEMFKGRVLRMNNMDTTEVQFYRGNNHRVSEGMVLGRLGNRMFTIIDKFDGSLHRRHRDQITISPSISHRTSPSSVLQPLEPETPSNTHQHTHTVPDDALSGGGTSSRRSSDLLPAPEPVPTPSVPASPTTEPPPLRRSSRTVRRPSRFDDYVSLDEEEL